MAELVVRAAVLLHRVAALLTEDRLQAWQAWLKWQRLHRCAPYLSSAFVDENFAFYGTTLQGTPQLRDRWKRGVGLVEGALGEAVGQVYVERHFSAGGQGADGRAGANLIEAYRAARSPSWTG